MNDIIIINLNLESIIILFTFLWFFGLFFFSFSFLLSFFISLFNFIFMFLVKSIKIRSIMDSDN